jgi:hypothetical protein
LQSARLAAAVVGLGSIVNFTHMEFVYQFVGLVVAMMIGILPLVAFFKAFAYFTSKPRGLNIVKITDFVKNGTLVNIHLSSGQVYRGVRIGGFSNPSAAKWRVQLQLSPLVVCETQEGSRIFIPSEAVSMIEELDDVA